MKKKTNKHTQKIDPEENSRKEKYNMLVKYLHKAVNARKLRTRPFTINSKLDAGKLF